MDQSEIKSTIWKEEEWQEGTPGPSITEIMENVPTLTVATVIGVTVVVIIAIAAVFMLGVLIDCRQQKLMEKKIGEVKRLKNHRRVHIDPDSISIANNMEEPGLSVPPAQTIQHIV